MNANVRESCHGPVQLTVTETETEKNNELRSKLEMRGKA